eukprot:TRINITY_DN1222_c0_g1_i1.p1 TRINITY_DN1222_c0_g1~~TRINITY_DN1222_c0_g1_i1.p1  ORF type:complete len:318 (+),score=59.76 TRINITY_DN1222_c0_g1_i1:80-1033(+)
MTSNYKDRERYPYKKGPRKVVDRSPSPQPARHPSRSRSRSRSPLRSTNERGKDRPKDKNERKAEGHRERQPKTEDERSHKATSSKEATSREHVSDRSQQTDDTRRESKKERFNRYKTERKNEKDDKEFTWGGSSDKKTDKEQSDDAVPKEKPNYEKSGALYREEMQKEGVEMKYVEPEDARKPTKHWRLYVYKGDKELEVLHIHRKSSYLIGREKKVVDIQLENPLCSKQHAVLQFRQKEKTEPSGTTSLQVLPYIIDLNSTNGTFLNFKRIESAKYYQLFEKDVLKFGPSSRQFVLLFDEMIASDSSDSSASTTSV